VPVPTRSHEQPDADPELDEQFSEKTRHRAKSRNRTRTIIKQERVLPPNALRGTVITAAGPNWIVSVDPGEVFHICSVSGTVDCPHVDTIVAVGDVVWITPDADHGEQGTIVRVEERRTVLSRKAAGRVQREQVFVANVDQLCIVMSTALPMYNKRLIDRYLIAADKGDLQPIICINKMDLFPDEEDQRDIRSDFTAYQHLGITCHFVSVKHSEGIAELAAQLVGRSTLFSGPSGVGKSSLINALTDSRQVVGAISDKYLTGKHTTSAAILIPLANGGSIIDSPGIRELAIWELGAEELPFYFEEFMPFVSECRYATCSHTHEPGCGVKKAVEEGKIDEERYVSYLNILESIKTPDLRA
jgi:ribosome biogenesis GTPase